MSEMAGNGNTPEITTSAIDTRIYGNPEIFVTEQQKSTSSTKPSTTPTLK